MAEFCAQCFSWYMRYPTGCSDMYVDDEEKRKKLPKDEYWVHICESCGTCFSDNDGYCHSKDCDVKHGLWVDEYKALVDRLDKVYPSLTIEVESGDRTISQEVIDVTKKWYHEIGIHNEHIKKAIEVFKPNALKFKDKAQVAKFLKKCDENAEEGIEMKNHYYAFKHIYQILAEL